MLLDECRRSNSSPDIWPLPRRKDAIMQPIVGLHEVAGCMIISVLFEKRRLSRLQAHVSQTRRIKTYAKPGGFLGD